MNVEYDLYSMGIMVGVISFLGFVLENLWLLFTKGYINNRNMTAPFLLGYGLLVVAIYILIGIPSKTAILAISDKKISKKLNIALYFVICMLIVSVGEILLGNIVEKLCGIEYWNYSRLPMHIGKYTSIPTSIGFAAIITFFMDNCFVPIMTAISNIPHDARRIIAIVLIIVMTLDFIQSFRMMVITRDFNCRWQIPVHSSHKFLWNGK